MKSQFIRVVLTAGLTLLGSLTLGAQDKQEIAKIPFAFHANHNSFAAGDYRVAQVNNYGLFQLRKEADGHSIFINTLPAVEAKSNSQGHLTFACYHGDCVLSQIWLPGSKTGFARSAGSVDRDLQRKLGVASMVSVRLTAH
ncbi:MAG TPA: hypothetical protein VFA65_19690 [Bryobacteraceae bacterium]|nr:hypothetical protein [Bryobacteraceae bacterium]